MRISENIIWRKPEESSASMAACSTTRPKWTCQKSWRNDCPVVRRRLHNVQHFSFLIYGPQRHELGAVTRLGVLWRGVDSMHRSRW